MKPLWIPADFTPEIRGRAFGPANILNLVLFVYEEGRWRLGIFVQTELFVCSTFEVYSILLYSCFKV